MVVLEVEARGVGRGWKEVSRGCWETAVVSGVKCVGMRLANGWDSKSARVQKENGVLVLGWSPLNGAASI